MVTVRGKGKRERLALLGTPGHQGDPQLAAVREELLAGPGSQQPPSS